MCFEKYCSGFQTNERVCYMADYEDADQGIQGCIKSTGRPKMLQHLCTRVRTLKTRVRTSNTGVWTLKTRVRTSETRVRGFAPNLAPCWGRASNPSFPSPNPNFQSPNPNSQGSNPNPLGGARKAQAGPWPKGSPQGPEGPLGGETVGRRRRPTT